jgi:NRAMP (natural resistance-associated macrophage protein)-like metal ion transporter
LIKRLGPGLITGASDDDPSGIGTYSQAGAQLGFGVSWTMLLTYPLMVAIQEISGRIGRVTGHGIAGNVCRNFPAPFIWSLIVLLLVANTINIAADLGAMADTTKLLVGGWSPLYVVVYATGSVTAQVFLSYKRYVGILKWLTLVLFAYVIALAVVHVPWGEAIRGLLIPKVEFNGAFLTTLIAIFGTTISPYLFVWQSSQEAEEQRIDPDKRPLRESAGSGKSELWRIRLDTLVGMAISNLIAIAILITTAATLHRHLPRPRRHSNRWPALLPRWCLRSGSSAPAFSPFRSWQARRLMPSAKDANGRWDWPASRRKRPRFIRYCRYRWHLPWHLTSCR